MDALISYLVIGLVFGAIYAINATGLVVTYTTTGVFNFAHGAIAMIAAYGYYQLVAVEHLPVFLAFLLIVGVGAPLFGAGIELALMRRLHGASEDRPVMVTIGLLLALLALGLTIWGSTQVTPQYLWNGTWNVLGENYQKQFLLVLLAAGAVAVGFRVLFRNTRAGMAMRAVVDDPDLLALAGASPASVSRQGWMLGTVLAALSGVLVAPLVGSMTPETLTLVVVSGLAAAVVGRLRNISLTFVAAMIVGVLFNLCNVYLTKHLALGLQPDFIDLLPMVFLLVALLLVPTDRLSALGRLATAIPPRVAGKREVLVGSVVFLAVAVILAQVLPAGGTGSVTFSLLSVGDGLVFGIVGLSLVLLTGYAGQISLCQMIFVPLGAAIMGKLAGDGSLLGLIVTIGVCAAVGAVVSLPFLRLRGLYLALGTFAFAGGIYYSLFQLSNWFGDNNSIQVGRPTLPGLSFGGNKAFFVLIAACFAISALTVLGIRRSSFGRRLVAMSDSPAACATLGLNTAVTKVAVFALSAGLAGLAGALYGSRQFVIGVDPSLGSSIDVIPGLSLLLILMVLGIRSVSGALLAGLSFAVLPIALGHNHDLANLAGLFSGVGIIVLGRLPNGLLAHPWVTERFHPPWARSGVTIAPIAGPLEAGIDAAA